MESLKVPERIPEKPRRGLVLVITGDGKGKTTSCLGMAVRAVGYGMKVLMVQFIKGSLHYGELDGAKRLAPDFELLPMGKGFVGIRGDSLPMEEHVAAAREALVEMVAEADDSLMEHFFEAGTLSQEDLLKGLRTGVASRKIFPLVCTSAAQNIAVQPVLGSMLTSSLLSSMLT